MLSQYAGVGEICPEWAVTAANGGSLTTSGTLYFSFQLQNRAGFNIPSVSGEVAYSPNQKITITIPEMPPGWDIHYFILSAGATSDPSTHVQIARYPGFEYGIGYEPQSVRVVPPVTIDLTHDVHLLLAPSVADLGSFPVGVDRLDGQVRWVTSESKWFEYRADSQLPLSVDVIAADIGQWVRIGGSSAYVSDTRAGVGSDRLLTTINPVTTIPTPPYPGETLEKYLPQWESQYWIYNNNDNALPAGTEFGIELEYNNERSPDLLSGLFMVKFIGFIQTDGTIRTQDGEGRDFPNLGAFFPWTPKLTTPFVTIDDLQPTEAIALAVKPFFSAVEIGATPKSIVGVLPVTRSQSGDYDSLGKFLPNGAVFDIGDRYRVVPNFGLSFDILSGTALVASYGFPEKTRRTFGGLQPNLAGQKIIINGNAAVYAELPTYSPSASEAIRAIVGTVAGESAAGEWGTYTAGTGFTVTLTYPESVRSDYPDVITGSNKAIFNPFSVNIYIQRADTLEIRKFSGFTVIADTEQEFTITNWASGTIVPELPSNDADFSLFAPGAIALAPSAGSFPATNFRATYSFEYDGNQITSISHASPPCIVEWDGDFQPASIEVNPAITILEPGEPPTVVNTGTANQAYLTFSFPPIAGGGGGDFSSILVDSSGNILVDSNGNVLSNE